MLRDRIEDDNDPRTLVETSKSILTAVAVMLGITIVMIGLKLFGVCPDVLTWKVALMPLWLPLACVALALVAVLIMILLILLLGGIVGTIKILWNSFRIWKDNRRFNKE